MEDREQGREEECKTRPPFPKGRRTKRFRPPFPSPPTLEGYFYQVNGSHSPVVGPSSPATDYLSPPLSPSSQESLCEHTEEEQAVASYLLLLSNGHESPLHVAPVSEDPRVQFTEAKSKNNTSKQIGPDGRISYKCTTCDREFPSFQALGGHRASHKKPKLAQSKNEYNSRTSMLEIRKLVDEEKEDVNTKLSMNSFSTTTPNPRVHQCTICGSTFTSGQALGGHMRRHRNPALGPEATSSDVFAPDAEIPEENETFNDNQTSPLALDLNLPAPLEEKRATSLLLSPVDLHF